MHIYIQLHFLLKKIILYSQQNSNVSKYISGCQKDLNYTFAFMVFGFYFILLFYFLRHDPTVLSALASNFQSSCLGLPDS